MRAARASPSSSATTRRRRTRSPSSRCVKAATRSSCRSPTSSPASRRSRLPRTNMAAYDLEEQEQIDDLKEWWARYGGAITVALVLGCLVIVGIQGFRWYMGKRAEDASVLYSAVSEAARTKDAAKAKDAIAQIEDRYAGTAYAPRAALLYAKMLYDAADRAGAKGQLTWVVEHSTEEELQAIARYRLAQVQ